jgi:hypothetical protein
VRAIPTSGLANVRAGLFSSLHQSSSHRRAVQELQHSAFFPAANVKQFTACLSASAIVGSLEAMIDRGLIDRGHSQETISPRETRNRRPTWPSLPQT